MGLFRLYWIPSGGSALEGGYVHHRGTDLLDLAVMEATRAAATLVGEDLGTVEPEVREALSERDVFGYRIGWFADDPPQDWPATTLASLDDPRPAHRRRDLERPGRIRPRQCRAGAGPTGSGAAAIAPGSTRRRSDTAAAPTTQMNERWPWVHTRRSPAAAATWRSQPSRTPSGCVPVRTCPAPSTSIRTGARRCPSRSRSSTLPGRRRWPRS